MFVLGIDDAGRGPVVGPMVLAGVLLDKKSEASLKKLGVKDSKQLTPKRREFLAGKIKEIAETFEIVVIPPMIIDKKNREGTKLNELEAISAAKIINKINKGYKEIKIILDCPSTSIIKWRDYLRTKIKNLSNLEVICEHKADKNHICVSAASILAKSTREKEMDKLKEIYGVEIGSGYTSDPLTQKFLKKNIHKYNDKGIFRKSWITWQNASKNLGQRKLF